MQLKLIHGMAYDFIATIRDDRLILKLDSCDKLT